MWVIFLSDKLSGAKLWYQIWLDLKVKFLLSLTFIWEWNSDKLVWKFNALIATRLFFAHLDQRMDLSETIILGVCFQNEVIINVNFENLNPIFINNKKDKKHKMKDKVEFSLAKIILLAFSTLWCWLMNFLVVIIQHTQVEFFRYHPKISL